MTRKITLLALVPVMALGLSACGSSSSDSGSSAAPSTAASSAAPSSPAASSSAPSDTSSSSTSAGDTKKKEPAVISIVDFAYEVPKSVAPGTKITIENKDSEAHTVTSTAGGFDVKVDPNGTATMTAPSKPGTYEITCDFHANMSGKLVVE